jgi:glycosyltransferase involved in cell wall biosynthesis
VHNTQSAPVNLPLISVIVTSFNQEKTIAQTLDSIICQKCNFFFEIIIGDDYSTDGTRNLILDYEQRFPDIIKPLFQISNTGVAANFVSCVRKAKGKFVAICAADDFWHNPAKLQLQVNFFKTNPDYGLLYTDYDKLNIHKCKIVKSYLKTSNKTIYEGEGLVNFFFSGKVPVLTLTVMFRKDLFDKYIPADDYIKLKFPLEDWPTWMILSKYTKIAYLPVSTATYRYGHESISNPLQYDKIENRFAREKVMYKYLCDMFPEDLLYNENEYIIYSNSILLNLAFKRFDYQSARNYALRLTELGSNEIKINMARNWIPFRVYALLKYLFGIIRN